MEERSGDLSMEGDEDGEVHSPSSSVDMELLSEESETEDTDTVSSEVLKQLEYSDVIKDMLCNHHLRQLLVELNESENPGLLLNKAMEIPIFSEFAEECLKICGLQNDKD